MPAKASGEVKTRIIHSPQKNGDIYVLERKTVYDPVKKYNKVLSTKLVSKIPKGTEISVPTRPKRTIKSNEHENVSNETLKKTTFQTNQIIASRKRVGMMNIIDHIGKASGIDATLYANTDIGTAQKIISLARYLLASDGQSLPGIATWQYNHPLPYREGISEEVYHRLFKDVGLNESLQQNFFKGRCDELNGGAGIAYDSTTFSTYSENQLEARYGFNKANDGLKTVKYLALYSIENRQPIAFTKQPGDLSDVSTISNALSQLLALGVSGAEIITDNGYYCEQNISEMFQAHFDFITLAKTGLKWIKSEINNHQNELERLSSVCPYDPTTHGITVMLMRDFVKVRKYSNKKTGVAQGEEETFSRRVYLHIYYNAARKVDEDQAFERGLLSLKKKLEEGTSIEDLNDAAQTRVKKYLVIRTWGKKMVISFNENACAQAKKNHGYFTLVSSKEKDTFVALSKYRKREYIEDYFRSSKQHADSMRIRVWDADTLRGRMFVQFISLCYYEYLSETVRTMKLSLGVPNGNHDHDLKQNLDQEKKLKSWLDNTPIYLQLQWFDAIEGIEISSALQSKRWTTEMTIRDNLFIQRLGLKSGF
ncbi:transposase [Fusibacter sp. 3D3]|uniref:IS1634 family transposase n=1 Tax=Fusibacter sp. 3D3 TaxID=1048380 RepID=UPI000853A3FA|nr:transposase [Fusibacter sp. 3D3]GAU79996.1 mobile element protein [Fusibacter sp. 3D3]